MNSGIYLISTNDKYFRYVPLIYILEVSLGLFFTEYEEVLFHNFILDEFLPAKVVGDK